MSRYDPSGVLAASKLPSRGWKTSRHSGPNGGDCVEVNLHLRGVVGVRDSKSRGAGALLFGAGQWRAFVAAATEGRLDR